MSIGYKVSVAFYIFACLAFATAHFCAYLGALRITKWIKSP